MQREVRDRRERWGAFEWSDFEPMFLERLEREDLADATVLDLGTGGGRLALALAPRAGRVVGIDVDEDALAEARKAAAERGLRNVSFVAADADVADYREIAGGPPDVVVANHFMSVPAVERTAAAVRPGGRFLFACHHRDHWIETGRVGRFSFGEADMEALLSRVGFRTEFLGVERLVVTYEDLEALAEAHPNLRAKFEGDGRWAVLGRRPNGTPVALTWATLVGVASRP